MEGERSSLRALESQRASLQDLDEIVSRFVQTFPNSHLQVFLVEDEPEGWKLAAEGKGDGPAQRTEPDDLTPDFLMNQALESSEVLLFDNQGQRIEDPQADLSDVVRAHIPVRIRNVTAGLLVARYAASGHFSAQVLNYLQTIASYIGISLHTQQLVDDTWQRTPEMETVYGVAKSARTLKPLYPTLAEIHAQLVRAFDVPAFFVALYDDEKGEITFPFAHENGEALASEPISISNQDSLVAWVIRNRRRFVTGDWQVDSPVQGAHISGLTPRSVLCFPLQVSDMLVGVLSVQSDKPHAFDEYEINLVASIADHVAVIVQNSRIYSNTQELVDSMAREYMAASAMRQAVSSMGTSLDMDLILQRFLSAIGDLVHFDSATLVVLHEDTFNFYRHIPYGDADEQAMLERGNQLLRHSPLVERVAKEREPLVIDDVRHNSDWTPIEGLEYVRSCAAVPMLAGNELVGILTLDNTKPGAFSQREIWLISTLASHASLSIQNARLHAEIQSQVRELTTLYEASAAINADLDRDMVLRTVVDEMVRALNLESCVIFLRQPGVQNLQVVDAQFPKRSDGAGNWQESSGSNGVSRLERDPVVQQVYEEGQLSNLFAESFLSDPERALLDHLAVDALLIIPFVQGERSLGVLLLGRNGLSSAFSDRDIRLARNLTGQAAAAIEHARLYTQARRRIDELSTFHQIVLQLNTPLELEIVLQNITDAALKLIEANNLHIYLWDEEKDEFTFCSALWRNGSREPAVGAPRKDGLTASVVHSGEAVIIENANSHPLYQSDESSGWGVQAIAGFPLRHGERVIGVFTVTYVEPHVFTPDERLLMNLLADQSAIAVENARLFSDAQQRLRSMSALVDMAKQVTGNLRVELVLQTTVQTLQKLLSARASTIALLSGDGQDLIVEAAAGIKQQYHRVRIKLGEGISGRAVNERRMIYIRDTYRESDFLFFDDVLRSLLVVPLISRNEVIGTLTVDSDRPYAFSDSDTQLLMIAAAQVSVAIASARLFEALEERAAELAVAYEELKENDRLKDELVQNVSHELRTPLTFIRGYVDLLVDGEMGELSPEQLRALTIVAEKTGEVTRLVEDIMSLQRIDSANLMRQQFSMAVLLESAIDCHKMSASKRGLDLILRPPTTKGIVEADRGRMNQVLDNLIGNAMKFSPDGGAIELRMTERKNDVLVVVSDQGIGIASDKVNRIFERFYQIDGSSRRRFGGAGIGLAIVKRIIDAHQGDIWIKSEIGSGSRFFFTVPKIAASTHTF